MIAAVVVLVALAAAADVDATDVDADAGPRRAVALFPLQAKGTVTQKQAKGVLALLRNQAEVLANDGAVRLLPATKDDDAALRRCSDDAACYAGVMKARGIDLLARGVVDVGDGGLALTLTALPAGQSFQAVLGGDDADELKIDRIVREVFAPNTLRGSIRVVAQPGDEVSVDGQRRGTTQRPDDAPDGPASFALERLREGEHTVVVTRPESKNGTAYEPFSRTVSVRHREVSELSAVLLPKASTADLGGGAVAVDGGGGGVPVGAFVVGGVGVVGVAAGVTFGVLSLLDAQDVEKRAAGQQLVFPRDQALVDRGATFAVVANVAYAVGVVGVGGALAWALLLPSDETSTASTASTSTTSTTSTTATSPSAPTLAQGSTP
jgi:hypothetical protein